MGSRNSSDTSVLAKAESLRGVAPCLSAALLHSTMRPLDVGANEGGDTLLEGGEVDVGVAQLEEAQLPQTLNKVQQGR